MIILDIIIEYAASSLNRPFSYAYFGDKIEKGTRVLVPFNNRQVVGYVIDFHQSVLTLEEYKKESGYEIKSIVSIIDQKPLLNEELFSLAKDISEYYFAPLISVLQTMLPPSLKPLSSSLTKPKIAYETYLKVINDDESDLTLKQIELLRLLKSEKELVLKNSIKSTIVKTLLQKQKIVEVKVEKRRLKMPKIEKEDDKVLSDEQKSAYSEILASSDRIFLLEGVTGSGKTEVYLQVAREILKQGKTVLILVPEIALTVNMIRSFKARFDDIAILHSELSSGEKYDEYRKIASGQIKVVVGARSAIFAPLQNLGLVIVDEEHVETYKQESTPFYHAVKVAQMRQKYQDFKLILGSATPSLESKARAIKGNYHQLMLTSRINQNELPNTEVIDMSNPKVIDKDSVIFSLPLRKAIEETLLKKEQVILLINRRGYSSFVSCRKCSKIMKCPECDVPLTYHFKDNLLKCHHCGHVEKMIDKCPNCDSTHLMKTGFGSEKIVEEVQRLFKDARVLRLDSDVSRIKNSALKVIRSFENREADILIGTQMIAKGHNFDGVTLVGVVLADLGLSIPSFRAAERTFDLLTQAIGRAGRSTLKGKAIIQTYLPNNYVIVEAAKQDYQNFFNIEIRERKLQQFPPYTYCMILTFSGNDVGSLSSQVQGIKNLLEGKFYSQKVTIIGPSEPFIFKDNGAYRLKLLLKYKSYEIVKPVVEDLQRSIKNYRNIKMTVNVDPYQDY